MVMLVISAIFAAISIILSVCANARFRGERRLPMQWGITGDVNWHAPRVLALAVMPALSIALLRFQTILAMTVPPRAGQEHFVLPILIGTGATLVAVQRLHVWLIEKTLRRNI